MSREMPVVIPSPVNNVNNIFLKRRRRRSGFAVNKHPRAASFRPRFANQQSADVSRKSVIECRTLFFGNPTKRRLAAVCESSSQLVYHRFLCKLSGRKNKKSSKLPKHRNNSSCKCRSGFVLHQRTQRVATAGPQRAGEDTPKDDIIISICVQNSLHEVLNCADYERNPNDWDRLAE
ncbi:hypothetical protein F2P81_015395 [Scophthalmus maximus]|uniref:Uncharacterized protein n=1 Tax=Scophthalmus maximus TaxID=52904 RepID=A0A6A4SKP8_SCOMX|nr:hypothetical protein F2P81_015395 [Scophthalmus maximus]